MSDAQDCAHPVASTPRKVAVTNAGGPVGRAVCAGLARAGHAVTGIADDTPSWVQDDYTWIEVDTTGPEVLAGIAGCVAVIHLECGDDVAAALTGQPATRRQRCERRAEAAATAAAAAGVTHLVFVTSAMVYGARAERPGHIPAETDILPVPDEGLVGDMVTVEQVADRLAQAHPRLTLTRVRPAALVGPGVDTVITRQFEAPRLLTLRGHEMRWQFCHLDDLVEGLRTVLEHRPAGPVTVGALGSLSPQEVEEVSGMRSLELPSSLAFGTATRLHRVGVLQLPVEDLSYVVHPWLVGSTRLRALGWSARVDNRECVRALLAAVRHSGLPGLRVTRKDAAALGAAGAAVAVVGTADGERPPAGRTVLGAGGLRGDRRRPGGRRLAAADALRQPAARTGRERPG